MSRLILCGFSVLALVAATTPVEAQATKTQPAAPGAAAASDENCAERIHKLEASDVQGAERLAANWEVVGFCAKEFKRDKTVQALAKECAKYLEQPVIKQLLVTDCQLGAYRYGSALRFLKEEYRK